MTPCPHCASSDFPGYIFVLERHESRSDAPCQVYRPCPKCRGWKVVRDEV